EIKMKVIPEPTNRFDKHACIVAMPPLEEIPGNLHAKITRPKTNQLVRDIAGKTVGRVPANLCRLFAEILDIGMTESITCTYETEIQVNGNTSFSRGAAAGGRDIEGGGPELKCSYEFLLKTPVNLRRFDELVKKNLGPNPTFEFQL
ncbi:unnamed protein product, partial [Owenia fusiformis]